MASSTSSNSMNASDAKETTNANAPRDVHEQELASGKVEVASGKVEAASDAVEGAGNKVEVFSEDTGFWDDGPYDDEWQYCLASREMDSYHRVALEQHREEMQELIDERETKRAEGDYSEGEDEYYNEAKHRGYEEENFAEYPTAQEAARASAAH
ncbi:hypothetical protein H0H92_011168 [Tricholoma furcatifolium]|nr:hypothetical protein H0H92_011168 [Tricholoma furcatifolium]